MTDPHAPEDPNRFLQNFGARITARRREIGLSQEALAYRSNLSTSTVSTRSAQSPAKFEANTRPGESLGLVDRATFRLFRLSRLLKALTGRLCRVYEVQNLRTVFYDRGLTFSLRSCHVGVRIVVKLAGVLVHAAQLLDTVEHRGAW